MTKTQDIKRGVLVRPFETLATNFLSSRYYDGRRTVDLLDTPADAHRWSTVIHNELRGPIPFAPSAGELAELSRTRGILEILYGRTVNAEFSANSFDALNNQLAGLELNPQVSFDSSGTPITTWTNRLANGAAVLTAAVLTAVVETLTGPQAHLLRKCHAPNCILYFTQLDSRQHWCSNVCGNRARVSRAAARADKHSAAVE